MSTRNKMGALLLAWTLFGGFATGVASAASDELRPNSDVLGCDLCKPGDDCPIEGEVCCPHAPGFEVPFTCSTEQCFRGDGELCKPGDDCPIEGEVCCPHEPGPTPFTCDFGDCFR